LSAENKPGARLLRHLRQWSPTRILIGIACLGVAGIAGYAFDRMNIPLAWVLGPLTATAALSMAGVRTPTSTGGRRFGQLVIGIGLGLNMSAELVLGAMPWFPLMIATAVAAVFVTSFFGVFLARAGGIDRITAYFAMMPGGLSEMANIGEKAGGRAEPIAIAQAIRLALVVLLLPPAIVALGITGDFLRLDAARALPLHLVLALFPVGLGGVWVMQKVGAANPWMLGGLIATAVVASFDLVAGQLPALLFNSGQFLLGVATGARFRRDILARLPRLAVLMCFCIVGIGVVLFGVGWLISVATGLDLATAALASSAGGVAEMALTAKLLQLNVALILGFHVLRAVMVNGFSVILFNALSRRGFFDAVERLAARLIRDRA